MWLHLFHYSPLSLSLPGVTCRYYRATYSCMADWIQSRPNCSDEATDSFLEAVLKFTVPFTTVYMCDIVATTPSPPGSHLFSLLMLRRPQRICEDNMPWGDVRLKLHGRVVTRVTLGSRLPTRHYSICIYCWTSRAKHWWVIGSYQKADESGRVVGREIPQYRMIENAQVGHYEQ